MRLLRRVVHALTHRRREAELREEIDFHLSLDAAEQSPDAARRRFGNVTRYTEETRDMSGLSFFDVLLQDARFALRTFRQAKGFTVVAAGTIARWPNLQYSATPRRVGQWITVHVPDRAAARTLLSKGHPVEPVTHMPRFCSYGLEVLAEALLTAEAGA